MPYEVTDQSTQHGINTPHGVNTPHKYPTSSGGSYVDIFEDLSRQLYPTGRAWYARKNGIFDRFHKAINRSFIRLIEDCQLTIDSAFPDNANFSIEDAELWEYRLGLITNPSVPLSDRMDAIRRKMAYPANVRARQSRGFIEYQLQQAGFDVYVHENKFFEGGEWVYKTPEEVAGLTITATQFGGDTQFGGNTQFGGGGYALIANSLNPSESYSIGGDGNLWATFFIGGETLGDYATIPSNRQEEFRELVLKLKPAHLVAFIFINFV